MANPLYSPKIPQKTALSNLHTHEATGSSPVVSTITIKSEFVSCRGWVRICSLSERHSNIRKAALTGYVRAAFFMFHVVLFSNVQRLLALLGFQSRLLVRGIYNGLWTRLRNPVSLILCHLYHRGMTLGITPFLLLVLEHEAINSVKMLV